MKYQYSKLEMDIEKFYKRIGVFKPIDFNLYDIAYELDVWIHYHNKESEVYKGKNGLYSIFLDERLTPQEQWQDFGHEIGHVIRHIGNQHKMHVLFRELQENQANNFMYHFCVPTFMLLNFEFPCYTEQAIYKIAHSFNVTIEFAHRRFFMYQNKQQQHLYQKQLQLIDRKSEESTEQIMDIEMDLEMGILPEEFYDFYDLSINGETKVRETIEFIKHIRKKEMR